MGSNSDAAHIARRWFEEVWNHRRAETIDELLTEESICHTADGPLKGPEGFRKKQFEPFLAAFPDFTIKIEGILSQGDQVVVRWVVNGSHAGDGLGFKATHKKVLLEGMTWIRVYNGKMMEGWQSSNIVEVIGQLSEVAKTQI